VQRQHLQAYEYLCHVGEAQQWIEMCLDQELGFGIVEMEEGLRNGVVLAKLARTFQGEGIVRRIYEVCVSVNANHCVEPHHLQAPKLDFRHSDNINHFLNFVRVVGLPEVRFLIFD
jgi:Ras GTPase-activating-like protein IQGAP2/3